MNDEALMGIYKELQTLRCLKQMELCMSPALTKTACSMNELTELIKAIKNPVEYIEGKKDD